MPVIELVALSGASLKVDVPTEQTVAELIQSVRAETLNAVGEAAWNGQPEHKILEYFRKVPDLLLSLVRGDTPLSHDQQVLDSDDAGQLTVYVTPVDEHPLIASYEPGGLNFGRAGIRQPLVFSRIMEILVSACDYHAMSGVPWFLRKGGPFRADVAIYMGQHLEEPYGEETKLAVLKHLALIVDSSALLQYVLDNCSCMENMHNFRLRNSAWFSQDIKMHVQRASFYPSVLTSQSLDAHVSLAWTAAYFGSVDVFRMLLFSGKMTVPHDINQESGGTMLHLLADEAGYIYAQRRASGHADIMKVILGLPEVAADWVTARGGSSRGTKTVLHCALKFVSQPQLCYDLCEALLSSRFGEALVRVPFRFHKEVLCGYDDYVPRVSHVEELSTLEYLEVGCLGAWPAGCEHLKESLRALFSRFGNSAAIEGGGMKRRRIRGKQKAKT